MNALSTGADNLSGRTSVRFGLALFVALGLTLFPFEAMTADASDGAQHWNFERKTCTFGCTGVDEICCI